MQGYKSTSTVNRNNKIHAIGKPAVRFYNYSDKSKFDDELPPKYFVNGKNVTDNVNEWLDERQLDIDNLSEEDYHALCIFMEGL